jgi:hypothetical protein
MPRPLQTPFSSNSRCLSRHISRHSTHWLRGIRSDRRRACLDLTAMLALFVPSRRAATVDPVRALRHQ